MIAVPIPSGNRIRLTGLFASFLIRSPLIAQVVLTEACVRSGYKCLLSTQYTQDDVELPVGGYATDLAILQFTYLFTPKSYLQSLIQYNSRSNQVGVNIRYALIRIANTGLYVVYNSRFDTLGSDPHDPGEMFPPPYRRTLDRALLTRFTYLFDFCSE